MAKNIFPILAAAAGAFFLLGRKGEDSGEGGEAGSGVGGPGGVAGGIASNCDPKKPLVVTVKLFTQGGVSHNHKPFGANTTAPTPEVLAQLSGDEVEWTTSKDAAAASAEIITIPLHDHKIELTPEQISELLAGKTVTTETTAGSGVVGGMAKSFPHTHKVELRCAFKGAPAGTQFATTI